MGDSTPSQFLRHMRDLAGSLLPEALLRTLWIGRLPHAMQAILVLKAKIV